MQLYIFARFIALSSPIIIRTMGSHLSSSLSLIESLEDELIDEYQS